MSFDTSNKIEWAIVKLCAKNKTYCRNVRRPSADFAKTKYYWIFLFIIYILNSLLIEND